MHAILKDMLNDVDKYLSMNIKTAEQRLNYIYEAPGGPEAIKKVYEQLKMDVIVFNNQPIDIKRIKIIEADYAQCLV